MAIENPDGSFTLEPIIVGDEDLTIHQNADGSVNIEGSKTSPTYGFDEFGAMLSSIDSIDVKVVDGKIYITSNDSDIDTETNPIQDTVNTNESSNLMDVLKVSNKNSVAVQDSTLQAIRNQNELLKKQIESTNNLTKVIASSTASIVKEMGLSRHNSNIINTAKIVQKYDSNSLKSENNKILKDKDMSTLVNNNIDTTPIAEQTAKIATATQTLATGVNSQIETNTKINEKLDFEKNGADTLKDTDGNIIKPREVKAKNHAEHMIDKSKENQIDYSDLIPSDDDLLTDDTNILQNAIKDFLSLDTDQLQNIMKADNNIKEDL